jgi:hypothetical protein
MVKSTKRTYTLADWRKDNPVESDIMDLIAAANSFADTQAPHTVATTEGPSGTLERCVDTATELELAIHRASLAIGAMLDTREGRKAAGLKPRRRGKEHQPDKTNRSDPQVEVVLAMLRGEKDRDAALAEVAKILSSTEDIDPRTLDTYVADLILLWGSHADPNYRPLWVENRDV